MGLTSRRKRPIDRTIKSLRDTCLIIIATEGERTEKKYFESALFGNHRVQVKVLPSTDGLSAPNHVLRRLREFANTTELQGDDQLWLVIDKDRWTNASLSTVCASTLRRNKKVKTALSNPCFELWLYLHCKDWDNGVINSKDMEIKLRALLGSYNKSDPDISSFIGLVNNAAERAKTLDKQPSNRWPTNPGTHVYKLIAAIRFIEQGSMDNPSL
jgi:hypothetical protein